MAEGSVPPPRRQRGERFPAALLALAVLAAIGFAVTYLVTSNNTQLMGLFASLGLLAIGAGMIVWAKRYMTPPHPEVEPRGRLASTEDEVEAFTADFEVGEFEMERRGLLTKLLGAAIAATGLAALVPFLSLGPKPGESFKKTKWTNGKYVVNEQNERVHTNQVGTNAVLTVFPENEVGNALSQALLIGLRPNELQVVPGRETWTPDNVAGFSKVCTHAGCPVGLYQAQLGYLICPCHQSTFNVYNACEPIFGPAATPLPQLPMAVDTEGYLLSTGDFSDPPGPGFWDQDRPG
ncbi:MAG: Rieske (2Fe-2S) protein [Actinobacteria bacterium]|nr:Rieske (2Fe-2S) protein [Actinomycetota bacterium]